MEATPSLDTGFNIIHIAEHSPLAARAVSHANLPGGQEFPDSHSKLSLGHVDNAATLDSLARTQELNAQIRNAAWLVRHYRRPMDRRRRAAAVRSLGLVVRNAFNECDDFEQLLTAVLEGLNPQEYEPPF
jgi:hypothetical protein